MLAGRVQSPKLEGKHCFMESGNWNGADTLKGIFDVTVKLLPSPF